MKKFRFKKDECMTVASKEKELFLIKDDEYTTNSFICLKNKYCTETKNVQYVDFNKWVIINGCKTTKYKTMSQVIEHIINAEIAQDAKFIDETENVVKLCYPSMKDGQREIYLKPNDYKRIMSISEKIKFRLTGYYPNEPLQIVLDNVIIGVIMPL